jgi:hypothetical protein
VNQAVEDAQYANSSFSVECPAVTTEAYAVCARPTERQDVHVAEALSAAAEGSYEQEAAAVRRTKRWNERMNEGWRSGRNWH